MPAGGRNNRVGPTTLPTTPPSSPTTASTHTPHQQPTPTMGNNQAVGSSQQKTKLSFSSTEDSCSAALAASDSAHMCPATYSLHSPGGSLAHKCRLFGTGAVVVLGGSFHFGYQISLINPMADVLQAFLERGLKDSTSWQLTEVSLRFVWASVAGLLFAGALLGAMTASPLLSRVGARQSLLLSTAILCTSFCLAAASKPLHSAWLFIFARLLSGVGIGTVTTVQTVYLTEISPTRYRGTIGTLTGFSTSVGFVAASGVGLPQVLGSEQLWPFAFLIECTTSLALAVCQLTLLYDSPVHSLRAGREADAVKCLRLYHPEATIKDRVAEFRREIATSVTFSQQKGSWWRLVSQRAPRQALVICTLLNATVSFSGILAVSFFGTFLLQGIGFSEGTAAVANCIASFSGIAGNVAGSWTVDRLGRRRLIIGGLSTLAVLNTLLMLLAYLFHRHSSSGGGEEGEVRVLGYAFLAIFMLFLFAFSFGVGPMAWFLATELSSSAHRPTMQSLAVSTQYLTCFVSPLLFFPLYQSQAGPLSFLLFIVPLLFTTGYLWLRLPETRGRSIEEIVEQLGKPATGWGAGNKGRWRRRSGVSGTGAVIAAAK